MRTSSGNFSEIMSANADGSFGNTPLAIRTPPMAPRNAKRARPVRLRPVDEARRPLELVAASAANAGPGFVAAMTKSTFANVSAIAA